MLSLVLTAVLAVHVRAWPAGARASMLPHAQAPLSPLGAHNLSWPPTYNMSLSTISNPDGNFTGPDAGKLLERDARYGIIVFDGGFEMCLNTRDGPADNPCLYKSRQADAEMQARNIHALNPRTHVFTYHNQEMALLRRHQDCEIMEDPALQDYFIINRTSGKPSNERKVIGRRPFCDPVAGPAAYSVEDQYALNFTNPNVTKWWLDKVMGDFISSPVLDGFYWDCPIMTSPFTNGLSLSEIAAVNSAMAAARAQAQASIAAAGKWALDMFTGLTPPNSCPRACTLWWRVASNCSTMCDNSAATCVKNLMAASRLHDMPSVMTIPYVSAGNNPNAASCESPSTVVADDSPEPRLELSCVPGTGTMSVEFASYGAPEVTGRGRFIQCAGAGCLAATHTGANLTYWEDVNTKTVYPLGPGVRECSECLRARDPAARCVPTKVNAEYFESLTASLETFQCGVQRQCTAFARNASCDAGPEVLAKVKALCDGREACSVDMSSLDLPSPPTGCGGGRGNWRLAVRTSGCQQGTTVANFRQQLAGFLLTRGPQSWMGHNWIAGDHPAWYPEWDVVSTCALLWTIW